MTDIAPTGQQVLSTNVGGSGRFLDIFAKGLSGLIDIELATKAASAPDRADLDYYLQPNAPQRTTAADTLRSLTPIQIGGLVVAGVLTLGLVFGWFRK